MSEDDYSRLAVIIFLSIVFILLGLFSWGFVEVVLRVTR